MYTYTLWLVNHSTTRRRTNVHWQFGRTLLW